MFVNTLTANYEMTRRLRSILHRVLTTSYLVLTKPKLKINQIVIFGQFSENCRGSQRVNRK